MVDGFYRGSFIKDFKLYVDLSKKTESDSWWNRLFIENERHYVLDSGLVEYIKQSEMTTESIEAVLDAIGCANLDFLDEVQLNEGCDVRVAVFLTVSKLVKTACAASSTKTRLCCLYVFVHCLLFGFLEGLVPVKPEFDTLCKQTIVYLCDCTTETLCCRIVDLMQQWPASTASFQDLQMLLDRVNSKHLFFQFLHKQMLSSLLHSGVPTKAIIDFYISCIRTMRILDPSFAGFDDAMKPLRTYLRQRPDAITVIVSLLLSGQIQRTEKTWEAHQANAHTPKTDKKTKQLRIDQPEDGSYAIDVDWEPPLRKDLSILPQSVKTKSISETRAVLSARFGPIKGSDIVSQLVQIYTSRDVFITAFQELLAAKLLKLGTRLEVESQKAQIDSLKSIFGSTSLHMCDVMIDDVAVSHALNREIHERLAANCVENQLHASILSRQFWPAMEVLDSPFLRLPDELKTWIQVYQNSFCSLKPDRELFWLPHLGSVELEIELDSGESLPTVTCTPIQASVILSLSTSPGSTATLEQLMRALVLSSKTARSALQFWLRLTVLREPKRGVYTVARSLDELSARARERLNSGVFDLEADVTVTAMSDEAFDMASDDAAVVSDGEDADKMVLEEEAGKQLLKSDGPGKDGRELNSNEHRMLTMVVTNIIRNLGPVSAAEICKRTSSMLPMFGNLKVKHIKVLAATLIEKGLIKCESDDKYEPVKKSSFA